MDPTLKYALIVFGVVVLLIFLTKIPSMKNKRPETVDLARFQTLVSDVKKCWNLAKQDQNMLLAVMHTTCALTKLSVIQQLDSSRQLAKKLDLDFEGLRIEIQKLQQSKLHDINTKFPGLALDYELDWTI